MKRLLALFLTSFVLYVWASSTNATIDIEQMLDEEDEDDFVEGASQNLTEYLIRTHNPSAPPDGRLAVEYELEIVHILGIDELKQTMTVLVYVDERWNDRSLRWEPENYGNITKTWLPLEKIWVPDIIIFNMLDHEDLLTSVRAPALIYANGTVETSKPFVSTVSCEIDIEHFPLDEQRCNLEIASWIYGKEKIKLHGHKEHATDHYTENEEWRLKAVHVKEQEFDHEGINVSEIKYIIHLQRKPLFYMVTLTFPSYLMCAISIVGLFARFSTTGEREERFTLGVTAILTMAVLSLVVSEKVPHSSTAVPLLVAYFLFNMVVVAVAAMTTGVVMLVHRKGRDGDEPSRFLMYIFLLKPHHYRTLPKLPDINNHCILDECAVAETLRLKVDLINNFIKKLIEACHHVEGQLDEIDMYDMHERRRKQENNGYVRIAERLDIFLMLIFLFIITLPVAYLFNSTYQNYTNPHYEF